MVHPFCQCVAANVRQEINIQNMNIELVAQMFKNYQNNVFFNLEGWTLASPPCHQRLSLIHYLATGELKEPS